MKDAEYPGGNTHGMPYTPDTPGLDFIRATVARDMAEGKYDEVVTRFPPEPNGFLHIGHAQSICLNFGIAQEWGGRYHLRFDDTNPLTEDEAYVRAIQNDIRWLGFDFSEHLYFASDYFEKLYGFAVQLIEKGKAYVGSQSLKEIRAQRGTVTEPGVESPYRDRPVEESLDLFRRMRDGEFEEGAHVVRARIDMAHPNMIMRDPVIYRILHAHHYRQGDAWHVYPLYDWAHCLEDAIEGITHSVCTLEFENNREIYDWILNEVGFEEPRPHQYEFARLDLDYTVLSKRMILPLIDGCHVAGWDDPRLSTIAGIRRRGVPPEALRAFCNDAGVTKTDSRQDVGKLEYHIRDHLNHTAPRVMGVLRPVKLVVENFPEDETEWLEAPYFPRDVDREGSRQVPFTRELYIEAEDFEAVPPEDFFRLAPGREVRLRYAFFVRCTGFETDPDSGEVTEIRCAYDPETRGGDAPDGRKVKGTLHWVSAERALSAEVRLYDRLFAVPDPVGEGREGTIEDTLNPESLVVLKDARIEPSVAQDPADTRYQFERNGYFWRDPEDSEPGALVFNRIVTLRDTWAAKRKAEERRRQEEAAAQSKGAPDGPDGRKSPRDGGESARSDENGSGLPTAGEADSSPAGPASRISDEREALRAADEELAARFRRYQDELGLAPEEADVLTGSRDVSDFFEAALSAHDDPGAVAAWFVNELQRELKGRSLEDLPFGPAELGGLVALVARDRVSRIAAKEVFTEMVENGGDPEAILARLGLEKVRDEDVLRGLVDEVLGAWPDKVAEYRAGKTGLLGFFIGQVMQKTDGSADPKLTRGLVLERLEG